MRKGFTLIELLVVVLIIGILSAVALPQYNRAVLKSRATQGFVTLSALDKAQQEYKLANGTFTTELDNLSIHFDDDSIACGGVDAVGGAAYCNMKITDTLKMEVVLTYHDNGYKWRCVALQNNNTANAVCKSFGGSVFQTGYSFNYYNIP